MDNLVLTRLATDLEADLPGALLEDFRHESAERFRLVFASSPRSSPLVVSLRPELPWVGRPAFRWDGPSWSPDPFAVATARALVGRKVERVAKAPCERALRIDFAGGGGLVMELATHGANLVLIAATGTIEAALRHPRRSAERLETGRPWEPRGLPPGRVDPFTASAEEIDAALVAACRDGEPAVESLRRALLGMGPASAELVVREAVIRGVTPGVVLRERLPALLDADTDVVIEGPSDPRRAAERGEFSPTRYTLLPWPPAVASSGMIVSSEGAAAATVGVFHDALERVDRVRARIDALGAILRGELRRTRDAEEKVREELRSFVDPQRFSRMGEALLAGLASARRSGESVLVPDPYDPSGRAIAIPAPGGRPLPQVAADLFQRGRRARRGAETAAARAEKLSARAGRITSLLEWQETAAGIEGAAALEEAMREEKLAVGLTRPTRAGKAAALAAPPRLEGVRMMKSADGWTILVGRTGRDNDRLTFKIAAPEDVWLHAADVPGAHVVIRNPDRKSAVPETTLAEAARTAAWFSDSRTEGIVDVRWTRRKNVRRARGVAGRVVLKRFETLRVRPLPPADGG